MDARYVGLAFAVVVPALLLSERRSTAVSSQLMQFAQSRAAQRLAVFYTQGDYKFTNRTAQSERTL